MPSKFLETFDSIFPAREESLANAAALWLDRAIYTFILLTALAAPVSIAATNIGWVTGVFLWFIRALFVKPRPKFFRTPVDRVLLAFWGWSLLSSVFSYAPDLSLDRLRVLTLFPIAYLIAQNIKKTATVRFLVGALIFSCLITVIWTFGERITGRGVEVFGVKPEGALARAGIQDGDTLLKINNEKLFEPEKIENVLKQNQSVKLNFYRPDYYADAMIDSKNLSNDATTNEILGFETWRRSRNWRSNGFYNHYTTYAEVLQLIGALVFGLLIAQTNKRSRISLILFICLLAMLGALLLTATRASQAAFLLSTLTILALGANRKVLLSALALFLPFAVIATVYVQSARNTGFVDSRDNSTLWRLTVWREGIELLAKHPRHLLVGVGIDSVKRYKCDWGLFQNCTLPAGHFHSTPLQIAVETGLPALFLWLWVIWCYGQALLVAIRRNARDDFVKGILLGALGGLVGFLASGIVHYNLGDSEVAMVFFLIVGLGLVAVRNVQTESI